MDEQLPLDFALPRRVGTRTAHLEVDEITWCTACLWEAEDCVCGDGERERRRPPRIRRTVADATVSPAYL